MKLVRRGLVILFTALVVIGLVPMASASAASGCSGGYSWLFGFANIRCSTGSYAVYTYCNNLWGGGYYAQGPRVWAPNTSTIYCNSGYRPTTVGYVSYS